ncbi:tocopherol cyclase family protein [Anaerocolumna xylanovorans]|uniref:Tocopherol cyclase n=1 Tax=Anaerocolumna xylanovorans DSM 12503 TaxID=1121345 RepID=A0A1M7YDN2_9FIRM|nr:tocopherol cyclase family protein [Anaerocolumna xylanovorans]SHO50744.1 Tocopherol cyclase [Anaerocolumna xylanovorans DSM 12503]
MKNLLKQRPYFEGWYFKHQYKEEVLAFIPGINREKGSDITPFLQIIAGSRSFCLTFSPKECFIDRKACYIRLGKNVFTKEGIMIDITAEGLTLKGVLLYRSLHPIAYSIMGFFRYLPFMECKHEVISMSHRLSGNLTMNDRTLPFDKGIGYIEKDWGHSFPSSYLWLQCNDFSGDTCSVMLSVAHIPLWGTQFTGCICAIHYKGKEYRLATYLGVRILSATPSLIMLRQGDYFLRIRIKETSSPSSYDLNAPLKGKMDRIIKEAHLCEGNFLLSHKKQSIFNLKSSRISLESSKI